MIVYNKAGGAFDVLRSPMVLAVLLGGGPAAALLVYLAYLSAPSRRVFETTLAAAWSSLALLLIVAEGVLRVVAAPTAIGERVGSLDLLPYDWERAKMSGGEWVARARRDGALDTPDDLLGWDLGRGRRSAGGLYTVSADGVRSSSDGSVRSEERVKRRVALIGDSFTFGEEVSFDDTWGERLARMLPDGTQVLNFGVPSHGLDQTLLKYRRDVRGLGAEVTVLSFLSGSPVRTTNVYLILRPGLELPYSKPRFVLQDGVLHSANIPPLSAEEILAYHSISDLPFVELDSEFVGHYWQALPAGWSYVARFLMSKYPRWPAEESRPSESDMIEVTARLIEEIVREIVASGSVPVIVSLPVPADLSGGRTRLRDAVIQDLSTRGIEVLNLSECLVSTVGRERLFVSEELRVVQQEALGPAHYSPEGNEAVASCLKSEVEQGLRGLAGR